MRLATPLAVCGGCLAGSAALLFLYVRNALTPFQGISAAFSSPLFISLLCGAGAGALVAMYMLLFFAIFGTGELRLVESLELRQNADIALILPNLAILALNFFTLSDLSPWLYLVVSIVSLPALSCLSAVAFARFRFRASAAANQPPRRISTVATDAVAPLCVVLTTAIATYFVISLGNGLISAARPFAPPPTATQTHSTPLPALLSSAYSRSVTCVAFMTGLFFARCVAAAALALRVAAAALEARILRPHTITYIEHIISVFAPVLPFIGAYIAHHADLRAIPRSSSMLLAEISFFVLSRVIRRVAALVRFHKANTTIAGISSASASELTDAEARCPVCFDGFVPGLSNTDPRCAKRLPCSHLVHLGCLQEWARHSANQQCPLCRTPISGPRPAGEANDAEGARADDGNAATPRTRYRRLHPLTVTNAEGDMLPAPDAGAAPEAGPVPAPALLIELPVQLPVHPDGSIRGTEAVPAALQSLAAFLREYAANRQEMIDLHTALAASVRAAAAASPPGALHDGIPDIADLPLSSRLPITAEDSDDLSLSDPPARPENPTPTHGFLHGPSIVHTDQPHRLHPSGATTETAVAGDSGTSSHVGHTGRITPATDTYQHGLDAAAARDGLVFGAPSVASSSPPAIGQPPASAPGPVRHSPAAAPAATSPGPGTAERRHMLACRARRFAPASSRVELHDADD
jgi:hypothetical protein